MSSLPRIRIAILIGALLGLAACETPAPPAPPPPPITLASQILEQASTFRGYMTVTAGISSDFKDAEQVAQAVRTGVAFEHGQLQQGAVAFAAVIALQEPNYVATIREFAVDPDQREDLARRIRERPEYAASFAHADKAAGLAIAALDGLGAKVWVAGRAVKQSAYDVQRQAWSKTNVKNTAERLEAAKTLSGTRLLAALADVEELRKASVGGAAMSLSGEPVAPPYSPTIIRGLAIAALAALGQAGEENLALTTPLLVEETADYCLNMSKLNVYQCLAVARPHYEDIFCLGQHSMIDIGQCVVKAAASPTPAFVEPPPPPRPEPAPARRPVAKASTKG
jgi:hypothetical protein